MSRSPADGMLAARRATAACRLACALLLPATAAAQANYELIYAFRVAGVNPVGRLAEAPDGSLYGVTYFGGVPRDVGFNGNGTIFALRPQNGGNWSFETVHVFQPRVEGGNPWGGLTLGSDGNFYGLAANSGPFSPYVPSGAGTIFRMTPSGAYSVLHYFSGHPDEGRMPVWRLREASDGAFYGSTCSRDSIVFRITSGGSFTPLYRFPATGGLFLGGVCPVAELIEEPDGLLYGHSTYAGAHYPVPYGAGTLFRIDPREPQPQATILHAFQGPDGAQPVGGLIPGPNGTLYGTTYEGGPAGLGSIYRREATGEVTTVHAFQGEDGARPYGSLFRAGDGALYGTASEGGANGAGTLFRIDDSGDFSVLHAFTRFVDGRAPVELMQARDGYFYGVTYFDGPVMGGTVFRLGPGNAFQTLHAFSRAPSHPMSGVVQATDGSFYGTTMVSGHGGTVFRLSPTRELTILHEFPGNGPAFSSGLIQATDGFLYGTQSDGPGKVFRIRTTGEDYSVVHSFVNELGRPKHGVIQASDGNFYGTVETWSNHASRIFRMDPSGNLTILHHFADGTVAPNGPLVEGADGALYGTTTGGTVFKVTKSGAFTQLHAFSGTDGSVPTGGLTRAPDGRLYGVTHFGGASGLGTIFRVEPTGGITTLHNIEPDLNPGSPLTILAAADGALYGVGASTEFSSTFFRYTAEGLTLVGSADAGPSTRLIQASDGAIYGTVGYDDGIETNPHGGGVFRLTLPPLP